MKICISVIEIFIFSVSNQRTDYFFVNDTDYVYPYIAPIVMNMID